MIIPRFDLNVSNWADSLTFRLSRPKEPTRSLISIINVRSKDIYMRTHLLSVILSYICLFPHLRREGSGEGADIFSEGVY